MHHGPVRQSKQQLFLFIFFFCPHISHLQQEIDHYCSDFTGHFTELLQEQSYLCNIDILHLITKGVLQYLQA